MYLSLSLSLSFSFYVLLSLSPSLSVSLFLSLSLSLFLSSSLPLFLSLSLTVTPSVSPVFIIVNLKQEKERQQLSAVSKILNKTEELRSNNKKVNSPFYSSTQEILFRTMHASNLNKGKRDFLSSHSESKSDIDGYSNRR